VGKVLRGEVHFGGGEFSGGQASFDLLGADFSVGSVRFEYAEFSGGEITFNGAKFSGAEITFNGAKFSGGTVDFSHAADWSHPPKFDWDGAHLQV
jgi:uncharacterized protein YjbI with pentapeptide repeats